MSHPNLLTVAARVANPHGGPDLEVRIVVDADRGLRFELRGPTGETSAADVSPHAGRLRDALTTLLGRPDVEQQAKAEGAAARLGGVSFHDNPYRKGAPSPLDWLYSAWEYGWTNADVRRWEL